MVSEGFVSSRRVGTGRRGLLEVTVKRGRCVCSLLSCVMSPMQNTAVVCKMWATAAYTRVGINLQPHTHSVTLSFSLSHTHTYTPPPPHPPPPTPHPGDPSAL